MIEQISENPFGIDWVELSAIKKKINEIIEYINKIEGGKNE